MGCICMHACVAACGVFAILIVQHKNCKGYVVTHLNQHLERNYYIKIKKDNI